EEIEFRLPIGEGIAGYVAQTGRTLNIKDAYSHPRFDAQFDKKSGFRTCCMLCMPMRDANEKIIGVFQIINKRKGFFSTADEEFLAGLSVHAALAIDKAELHQKAVEKMAIEREMELAADIQQHLLPATLPQVDHYEFSAINLPAKAIGGDYYDFMPIDNEKICFTVADVAGKGIPASLLMATIRTAIHSQTHDCGGDAPAHFISQINNIICECIPVTKFITLFYGELYPATGSIMYVNAGHNPPIVLRNKKVEMLETGGLTLGVLPNVEYKVGYLALGKGDALLMYTDGVTEAMNADSQEFGEERLIRIFTDVYNLSADGIIDRIVTQISEHRQNAPQSDDITIAVIKRI
ncbi:SpoIIE family protein phosphatase, partial [candidate division KSB1 bacterium]|nr:SpoIIE family protein phosphatase [candidate division KSB1 bacterium]